MEEESIEYLLNKFVQLGIWTTQYGEKKTLDTMTPSHIVNVLKRFKMTKEEWQSIIKQLELIDIGKMKYVQTVYNNIKSNIPNVRLDYDWLAQDREMREY